MDLSIIVPCHNLEKYIKPLLLSLNRQVFTKEVEAIFVLDDCIDNTETVIRDTLDTSKYSLKIHNEVFHACGLARNKGLELSCGKYIWFMDGDDWLIQDDAIEGLLGIMIDRDYPMLRFRYTSQYYPYSMQMFMMVWQYIFKRETIGDIRFTNIQPHEDLEFMRKIFTKFPTTTYMINLDIYYYNYGRENSNMMQY